MGQYPDYGIGVAEVEEDRGSQGLRAMEWPMIYCCRV